MIDNNRINHFVWAVEPENMDRYVQQLSELFTTTFDEVLNHGARVLISWDTGLEFVTPHGEGSAGEAIRAFLRDRGEGAFGLVFRVPNIDAAVRHADALGWPIEPRETKLDISWTAKVTDLRERLIGPFLNMVLLYAEVCYADEDRPHRA